MLHNRRTFLKNAGLTTAGLTFMMLNNNSCVEGKQNPYKNDVGIQLWSVRDQLEADPKATLTALAEFGYNHVEPTRVAKIDDLKPILDDLGLKIKSSHFDNSYMIQDWSEDPEQVGKFESLVEKANKLGLTHLVLAYLSKDQRRSIDQYKRYCDNLNKGGEICAKAGIKLAYHNHSFEFEPINGVIPYEVMIDRIDPELASFELDVFWAQIGGLDPIQLINRLRNRISLFHLKDLKTGTPTIFDEGKVPKEAFKELGNGSVDIPEIVELGIKYGVDHCMIEQDQSPDPISSMGESYRFLQTI